MRIRTRVLLILLTAVIPVMAQAIPPRFTARVDQNRVFAGEKLEIIIELSADQISSGISLPAPELSPQLTLLRVSGPMSQKSTHIINGQIIRSASVSVTYVYLARKPGIVNVPSFECDYYGRTLRTDPLEITVLDRPAPPDADARAGWRPPSDPYLEVRLDKKEVYVGEPVVAAWTIYFRAPLHELRFSQEPSMGNYLTAELSQATKLLPTSKMIGGAIWQVAFLKSVAIYPIREGEIEIGSLGVSYFRDVFNEEYLGSDSMTITVKGLPEAGRPVDFSGAVGQFKISADRSQGSVEVDSAFEFMLTVEGSGHPDLMPDLRQNYNPPKGVDLYVTGSDKNIQPVREGILATRTFKISVVPRAPGEYTLPPFQFSYFDPADKKYQTAASSPIRMTATSGKAVYVRPRTAENQIGTPLPPSQLVDLKPDRSTLKDRGTWVIASPTAVALQAVPLFIVAAAFLIRRRQDRLMQDVAYARKLRAGPKSKKAIFEAERILVQGDHVNACSQAHRGLAGYIADLLGKPEQSMTAADADEALTSAGVPRELIDQAVAILEQCDQVRFAPSIMTEKDCQELFKTLRVLIKALAREVKA